MKIGPFDLLERPIVVAEIGNNHEGSYELAAELIHLAKVAGADAVKFQTINPWKLAAGDAERLEELQRICLPWEDFEKLAKVADHEDILFMSTPFDTEAVDLLTPLVPAFKIASRSHDDFRLIGAAYATGKPVLVSTGMGNPPPLFGPKMMYLHCVSKYPTPPEEASLVSVLHIQQTFGLAGYSDHTIGTMACKVAAAYGARVIEKHFTIAHDHSAFRDHQLSATPDELAEIVRDVKEVVTLAEVPFNNLPNPTRWDFVPD